MEFEGPVDFSGAVFDKRVDFNKTTFRENSICLDADFVNGAAIKWEQIKGKLKYDLNNDHGKASEEYGKLTNIFRNNNDYQSMDKAWELFRHHASMADEQMWIVYKKLLEWVVKRWTGYGTKPRNVFLTSLGVILVFAFVYSFFGQQIEPTPVGWDAYLYFSLTTFIAAGVEGIHPNFGGWLKVLVVTEAFVGFLLMTLFIVMLARKLTR